MCTGKKERHHASDLYFWPAGSDLPLYLTWNPLANLYISLDLLALSCLYIWPARPVLPLYLTCKLWPTFIFYLTCKIWPTFIFDLPSLTYLYIWTASGSVHCPVCWSPWPDRTPLLSVCWRWTRWQSTWTWTLRPCAAHRHPSVWCRLAPSGGCQWRLLTTPGMWRSLPLALGTLWRQSGETLGQRGKSPHRRLHLLEGSLCCRHVEWDL